MSGFHMILSTRIRPTKGEFSSKIWRIMIEHGLKKQEMHLVDFNGDVFDLRRGLGSLFS